MIARPDEEFELLLADLDRKVAEGIELGDTTVDGNAELSDRLDLALDCLQTLERIWPRAESASPLATPRTLGRFRLIRELGRGGFGIVYLAEDPQLGRDVALKVQRPEAMLSPTLRNRFVREAHSAAALKHPHIVTVFDSGEDGLWCWIASERISGPSLSAYLAEHPLPSIGEACRLVLAMADALAHSHAQGILHRDLKPGNVLLEPRVGQPAGLDDYMPKLTDFSLAKLLEDENSDTRTGARLGTPAYMAPEQVEGRKGDIGPATDVYGLGVLLYQLLAGQTPFVGEMESEILKGVLLHDPPPLRKARKEIPRDLEAIVLKSLEKSPSKRYPTAKALANDLRRFLEGQSTDARPLTLIQRSIRSVRRHPVICAALIPALAAVALLIDSNRLGEFRQRVLGVRAVTFRTVPVGARLAIAPIDERTNEPFAHLVVRPKQRSPTTVELAPGNYLVVAVLNDGRFHEVYRYVPHIENQNLPEAYRNKFWNKTKDDRIELFPIKIPELNVTEGMARFEQASDSKSSTPPVAPFYLDTQEFTNADFELDSDRRYGSRKPFANAQHYSYALTLAERHGKRLPSAWEFEEALKRCQPPDARRATDSNEIHDGFGPVGVPADDVTDTEPPVVGLRSNVAEWTTTGEGSYSPTRGKIENMRAELRLVRGGNRRVIAGKVVRSTEILVTDEPVLLPRIEIEPGLGFRFARSVRPRFFDAPPTGKR